MTSLRTQRRARLETEAKLNAARLAADHGASLPGITPASLRDILQTEANKPLRGGAVEMPHDSLFGEHNQREMF